MYNEHRKNAFIHMCKLKNKTIDEKLSPLFSSSEQLETKFEKDICQFLVEEVEQFYKSLHTTSYMWLFNTNAYLAKYADFCFQQQYVSKANMVYNNVSKEFLLDCLDQAVDRTRIVRRDTLIEYLNSDNIANACEKFIILGIFEGISGKFYNELLEAKITDIDRDGQKIKLCTGRELSISPELVRFAEDAAKAEDFKTSGRDVMFNKEDDPALIIKRKSNATESKVQPRFISNMFDKYKKECTQFELSRSALRISGILDTLKSIMETDGISSPEDCYATHREAIIGRYSTVRIKEILDQYGWYFDE